MTTQQVGVNEAELYDGVSEEDEPIASTDWSILWENQSPSVYDLHRRYSQGRLNLHPEFQRRDAWNDQKRSRFIESVLLNIPLPYVYLAEEIDGRQVVVDGQQRLSALFRYMENRYSLTGGIMEDYKGKWYRDLQYQDQEKIENRAMNLVLIRNNSDPDTKYIVFERLNTGAVQLNPQEIRNCVNRGPYNDLVNELTEHKPFKELYGITNNQRERMRDAELILRFFAFYHSFPNYKGGLKKFLNTDAVQHQKASPEQIRQMRNLFIQAIDLCKQVFGNKAFRLYETHDGNGDPWHPNTNNALQDAVMYGFATRIGQRQAIIQRSDAIREALINLMAEKGDFWNQCANHTADTRNVLGRFNTWIKELDEVLQDAGRPQPRLFSRKLKQELLDQDPTCKICQQHINDPDTAEIDHIKPYWKGGETIPENARLTHRYCNRSRRENRRE